MSPEIWIGLGSNLGDRQGHLKFALERLSSIGRISHLSSLYETEPRGKTNQPLFLNAACSLVLETEDPFTFLEESKLIEKEAGRSSGPRWGPRPLDLDLLFWGSEIIESENLTVPHPRIAERRFVLIPLCEIAAEFVHPVYKISLRQMLENCPDQGLVRNLGRMKRVSIEEKPLKQRHRLRTRCR